MWPQCDQTQCWMAMYVCYVHAGVSICTFVGFAGQLFTLGVLMMASVGIQKQGVLDRDV